MKKLLLIAFAFLAVTVTSNAQNKKADKISEVKFNVKFHCHSCKEKMDKVLPFEKGVKDYEVNIDENYIIIKFDNTVTSTEKLIKLFEKMKYEVTVDAPVVAKKSCCSSKTEAADGAKKSCGENATTAGEKKSCCSSKTATADSEKKSCAGNATADGAKKGCCKSKASAADGAKKSCGGGNSKTAAAAPVVKTTKSDCCK